MDFDVHTRPSTWLAVTVALLTAFSAFPSWPSAFAHLASWGILALALLQARREGKHDAER
jgi:hypothetical protein